MNKLQELYQKRDTFLEFGSEVPAALAAQIAEAEKEMLQMELLPIIEDSALKTLPPYGIDGVHDVATGGGLAVGDDEGGRADGYRVGRHVDVYRRVWRNQHIVPDGNAADDARVGADIDIVADFGCTLVFAKRMTDNNTLRRIVPRASRILR